MFPFFGTCQGFFWLATLFHMHLFDLFCKVFEFWGRSNQKKRTKMITSSLATTASCPSGDQRRQSRTFGRSLNLTSRSIFRNGFECEGIRGPAEGAWGKIDNGAWCRYGNGGLIARAFFLYASAFSNECCCSVGWPGIMFYAFSSQFMPGNRKQGRSQYRYH